MPTSIGDLAAKDGDGGLGRVKVVWALALMDLAAGGRLGRMAVGPSLIQTYWSEPKVT